MFYTLLQPPKLKIHKKVKLKTKVNSQKREQIKKNIGSPPKNGDLNLPLSVHKITSIKARHEGSPYLTDPMLMGSKTNTQWKSLGNLSAVSFKTHPKKANGAFTN